MYIYIYMFAHILAYASEYVFSPNKLQHSPELLRGRGLATLALVALSGGVALFTTGVPGEEAAYGALAGGGVDLAGYVHRDYRGSSSEEAIEETASQGSSLAALRIWRSKGSSPVPAASGPKEPPKSPPGKAAAPAKGAPPDEAGSSSDEIHTVARPGTRLSPKIAAPGSNTGATGAEKQSSADHRAPSSKGVVRGGTAGPPALSLATLHGPLIAGEFAGNAGLSSVFVCVCFWLVSSGVQLLLVESWSLLAGSTARSGESPSTRTPTL